MAKLSIIIPIYNVEAYVEKCLQSVINQTLNDIEIILVNDGTKDNSMRLCERFISNDKRIVVINKENGGLMSAWIAGVKVATGEYIGFVDSDDWVDSQFFEELYNEIIEKEADVVVGQYISEYDQPTQLYRSKAKEYCGEAEIKQLVDLYLRAFLYEDNPISYCRWDKVYRAKIIKDNLGYFNEKISLGEDVNANFAILPDCNKVVVLNNTSKYHYRINLSSIFHTYNEKAIMGIVELHNTLMKIAIEKELDMKSVKIFIGNMIFEEVNKIIRLHGFGILQKCSLIKNVLFYAPDNSLKEYSCARESLFIRIYCALLNRGAILLCVILRICYERIWR